MGRDAQWARSSQTHLLLSQSLQMKKKGYSRKLEAALAYMEKKTKEDHSNKEERKEAIKKKNEKKELAIYRGEVTPRKERQIESGD